MMIQRVTATFKNGAFVPDDDCNLPENARVQLTIESDNLIPPKVTDEEERRAIRAKIVERMRDNPIPASAPRFTREELHERR